MSDTDFFQEPTTEVTEEPGDGKVTIGNLAYEPSQWEEFAKLGQIAKESSERYNTDITRVYPAYTKTTQENKELREKLAQYESQASQPTNQATNQPVTDQNQIQQALEEAGKLGFVTDKTINQRVGQILEARDLYSNVEQLAEDAQDMGIQVTPYEILDFMEQGDYHNPQRAFNDMFEDQVDAYRQSQIERDKPGGLYTTDREFPTENRQPRTEPMTEDAAMRAMAEIFGQ